MQRKPADWMNAGLHPPLLHRHPAKSNMAWACIGGVSVSATAVDVPAFGALTLIGCEIDRRHPTGLTTRLRIYATCSSVR